MRFLFFAICIYLLPAQLFAAECAENTQELGYTFETGASWSLCASMNAQHGLQLDNIHYQAPGDISRLVLTQLHLAQILLHYHDQAQASALIGPVGLGGNAVQTIDARNCSGQALALPTSENLSRKLVCSQSMSAGILSKYSVRPSLQGHQWQLFSVSEKEDHTWRIGVIFGEAGNIVPGVMVSGRAERFSSDARFGTAVHSDNNSEPTFAIRATLLYTWRMAFNLDNSASSSVEEFDFTLNVDAGNRREMRVRALNTEVLRTVNRERFRGWRVRNTQGKGYYLDPQNSGYRYTDKTNNWAQFDLALSRFNACELHALNNVDPTCGNTLDDFVNGESLENAMPVLWYSQSRVFHPRKEDYPAMSSMNTNFELIPFDWTASSPFELGRR